MRTFLTLLLSAFLATPALRADEAADRIIADFLSKTRAGELRRQADELDSKMAALKLAQRGGRMKEVSAELDRLVAKNTDQLAQGPTPAPPPPKADPLPVVGPQTVSVNVGQTTTFTLKTTATIQSAGWAGDSVCTVTQSPVAGGIQFNLTGTAAGRGEVIVVTDQIIQVKVTVTVPAVQPIPVPTIPGPAPDQTPTPTPAPPAPIPIPPAPTPTPPAPTPTPAPVPTKLWGVVIVEDTPEAVMSRIAWLSEKAFLDYRAANGTKTRVIDKTTTKTDVTRFLDDAKGKKLPVVYIVDAGGNIIHSEPVPATAAGLVELLKQWSK